MGKLEESQAILKALDLSAKQQNVMCGFTLLALAGLKEPDPWPAATQSLVGVRPIIRFITAEYGQSAYDREAIRRKALHQFEEHRVVNVNPDKPRPKNSDQTCYSLTDEALAVIRLLGTDRFTPAAEDFIANKAERLDRYRRMKQDEAVAIELPHGVTAYLSTGRHNELQADVVRHFYPNFIPDAKLIYLGDAANRSVPPHKDDTLLTSAGLPYSEHDKFPDVVFWWEEPRWLILVEAVTAHGPFSATRKRQIEDLLLDGSVHPVFVTAFPSIKEFKKHLDDLAWDTEVWIAEEETRDHMIHFNGPKFLAPFPEKEEGE
ncbi:MAG: hypothetical protein L0Z62_36895 [Gemmataceae bacterium]|nr:hypothetical protein [Gemmataceae bacterium]